MCACIWLMATSGKPNARAKDFAKDQGVEYFVFINGAEIIPT